MTKTNQTGWKRISKIITWVITIIIGLVIIGVLLLKFAPGYSFYVVRSGSMVPALNVGDVVVTGPVGEVHPGQIITFEQDDALITHRVVSVDGDQITTKGDANKAADIRTTSISMIKGSYLFKIPAVGYLTNLVSTRKGWFFVVIVPTVILVLFLVKDILKEALKSDKKPSAKAAKPAPQKKAPAEAVTASVLTEKVVLSQPVTAAPLPQTKVAAQPAASSPVSHNRRPKEPVAASSISNKKSTTTRSVFTSREVTDNLRNELKRILSSPN